MKHLINGDPMHEAIIMGLAGAVVISFLGVGTLYFAFGPQAVYTLASAAATLAGLVIVSKIAARGRRSRQVAGAYSEQDAFLASFDDDVRHIAATLTDPWRANVLWCEVGLGTEPTKAGPGEYPKLRPSTSTTPADPGIWPNAVGVRVRLSMLPNQQPADYAMACKRLANALNLLEVRVVADRGNAIVLDCCVRDPLMGAVQSPLMSVSNRDMESVVDSLSCHDDFAVGITEDGDPVLINFANSAHGAIQGVTRSGKSITVNSFLAHASLMRDVELTIIDPNVAAAAPWYRTAHRVCTALHPDEASEVIAELRREMAKRAAVFWRERTDRVTEFSVERKLGLLVIDEVLHYTTWHEPKARNRFKSELQAFSSEAAKFGYRLWLLGQKLDASAVTTTTRTNLFSRICHRVSTRQDFEHLFNEAETLAGLTAAKSGMPQGVAVTQVPGMSVPKRTRSVYLPTETCWEIADAIVAVRGEVRPLPTDEELDEHVVVGGDRAPVRTIDSIRPTAAPSLSSLRGLHKPKFSPDLPDSDEDQDQDDDLLDNDASA
ncbi:FtsK/SpoIIIE domain-containing protein [Nocardia neocaledoniensis]|uniref:FtsK/SpoIIIE domain-containing protein n=1 Tax=Nocardia neocaledoniensis TaxID=236511 RepID=UPI0033DC299E